MGEALRRDAEARRVRRRSRARLLAGTIALALLPAPAAAAPEQLLQLERGRFTVVASPRDLTLARAILERSAATDTFPGLPRPTAPVRIEIAPDHARFRAWAGAGAPEWGAAIAIPEEHRIVMQGQNAGSDAGDPMQVLRHELAHLALHEALADLPPRWFDEGYAGVAAHEWHRDEVLAASVSIVVNGIPALDSLDLGFYAGATRADAAYALAYRAVDDLASLDPERGLALFFRYWKQTGSMDRAMREAYGVTEDEFQQLWRHRTMRRYGALALAANLAVLFSLTGIFVVPFYVVRRRRQRATLAAMRHAEEAAEREARQSALEALLRSVAAVSPERPAPGSDGHGPDHTAESG